MTKFDDGVYEIRESISSIAYRLHLSGKDIVDILDLLKGEDWGE